MLLSGAPSALTADDSYTRSGASLIPHPGASYMLSGPCAGPAGHLPVRGDLAHIALAGKWFVPHYAVPMPHVATAPTSLRRSADDGADVLATLVPGAGFDVLDMAGAWAWGQMAGGDGWVGYVRLDQLAAT